MLGMFLAFNFHHNLEAGTPVSPVLPLMALSLRHENLWGVLGGGGTAELLAELGPPWGGVGGRGYFTPDTSPPQSLEHPGLSCLCSSRGPHPQKNLLPTSLHHSALGTLP